MRSSSVRSGARPPVANALSARDLLDPEPAARALVGERGVHEAVEQHEAPRGQQRLEALLDELGARGGVEQRLGAGADAQLRVLDQRADPLGEHDAAGLAQRRSAPELARERRRRAWSCPPRRAPRP